MYAVCTSTSKMRREVVCDRPLAQGNNSAEEDVIEVLETTSSTKTTDSIRNKTTTKQYANQYTKTQ